MHQNPISAGAPPQTRWWGAYSVPPDLLAGFQGVYILLREVEGGERCGVQKILKINPALFATALYLLLRQLHRPRVRPSVRPSVCPVMAKDQCMKKLACGPGKLIRGQRTNQPGFRGPVDLSDLDGNCTAA